MFKYSFCCFSLEDNSLRQDQCDQMHYCWGFVQGVQPFFQHWHAMCIKPSSREISFSIPIAWAWRWSHRKGFFMVLYFWCWLTSRHECICSIKTHGLWFSFVILPPFWVLLWYLFLVLCSPPMVFWFNASFLMEKQLLREIRCLSTVWSRLSVCGIKLRLYQCKGSMKKICFIKFILHIMTLFVRSVQRLTVLSP